MLGRYLREEKVLTLMDALKKMTTMPARRLEGIAPAMRLKGHLQVGCDADITIFNPRTVIDQADFTGLRFSAGIEHVLVNGVLVIINGNTVPDTYPGQPVLGKYRQ